MRQPDIWTAGAIQAWGNKRAVRTDYGTEIWLPARPEPHTAFSWRWRFKLAWMVLIGRYDALRWED